MYRSVTCPILVLRGEHSDILSSATTEKMKAENANTTVVEVPGVAHPPLLTEPESTAALESFLPGG